MSLPSFRKLRRRIWKVNWVNALLMTSLKLLWVLLIHQTFLKILLLLLFILFKICFKPPLGHYLHIMNTGFSATFHFRMSLWTMGWKMLTPSVKHISIARITLIKENQSPNQMWELQPWFPYAVFFLMQLNKTTLTV